MQSSRPWFESPAAAPAVPAVQRRRDAVQRLRHLCAVVHERDLPVPTIVFPCEFGRRTEVHLDNTMPEPVDEQLVWWLDVVPDAQLRACVLAGMVTVEALGHLAGQRWHPVSVMVMLRGVDGGGLIGSEWTPVTVPQLRGLLARPPAALPGPVTSEEIDRCHEATEFGHTCRVCVAVPLDRPAAGAEVMVVPADGAEPAPSGLEPTAGSTPAGDPRCGGGL